MSQANRSHGIGEFITGILLGSLAGGILALLFAPKQGPETREVVKDWVSTLPEKLSHEVKDDDSTTRSWLEKTKLGLNSKVNKMSQNRQASRLAAAKQREDEATGFELN
jgi:gas vesicle protein